jgi:DNA-binding transcriptional MerR regulator
MIIDIFDRITGTTLRQNSRTPRHKMADVGYNLRQRKGCAVNELKQLSRGNTSSESDRMTDETDVTLNIREMCDAYQVTPRTLRFYEAKELLFPIREGQKRLFTKRDRARLKLILRGKRFGFSLEEIRQLLDLYHMGDQQHTQLSRTYEIARERLADMERQRDELNEAIDELKEQLKWGEKVIASAKTGQEAAE